MPKSVHKPPFTVIKPTSTSLAPPRKLGEHGLNLWKSVQNAYRVDDVGGIEMLAQALCGTRPGRDFGGTYRG
jgi:hypothetical protein